LTILTLITCLLHHYRIYLASLMCLRLSPPLDLSTCPTWRRCSSVSILLRRALSQRWHHMRCSRSPVAFGTMAPHAQSRSKYYFVGKLVFWHLCYSARSASNTLKGFAQSGYQVVFPLRTGNWSSSYIGGSKGNPWVEANALIDGRVASRDEKGRQPCMVFLPFWKLVFLDRRSLLATSA